jgi:hypothetical protein
MQSFAISCLAGAAVVATALGIGPSAPAALACGRDCGGYGFRPAPPGYYAPPVYSYSYYAPYRDYARGYRVGFYTTRINIFRGPRWNYAAAYYNPRPYRGCGRHAGCAHRAYMTGPVVPISGPVGRGWRR